MLLHWMSSAADAAAEASASVVGERVDPFISVQLHDSSAAAAAVSAQAQCVCLCVLVVACICWQLVGEGIELPAVCLLRDCPLEEEEEITGASNLSLPQSVIVFHFDAT